MSGDLPPCPGGPMELHQFPISPPNAPCLHCGRTALDLYDEANPESAPETDDALEAARRRRMDEIVKALPGTRPPGNDPVVEDEAPRRPDHLALARQALKQGVVIVPPEAARPGLEAGMHIEPTMVNLALANATIALCERLDLFTVHVEGLEDALRHVHEATYNLPHREGCTCPRDS